MCVFVHHGNKKARRIEALERRAQVQRMEEDRVLFDFHHEQLEFCLRPSMLLGPQNAISNRSPRKATSPPRLFAAHKDIALEDFAFKKTPLKKLSAQLRSPPSIPSPSSATVEYNPPPSPAFSTRATVGCRTPSNLDLGRRRHPKSAPLPNSFRPGLGSMARARFAPSPTGTEIPNPFASVESFVMVGADSDTSTLVGSQDAEIDEKKLKQDL